MLYFSFVYLHCVTLCACLILSSAVVSNGYISKCSGPYWSNPPFKFFDIRALWRSWLSARVPECQKIKNGELDQYGTECFGRLIFATSRRSVGLTGLMYDSCIWQHKEISSSWLHLACCILSTCICRFLQHAYFAGSVAHDRNFIFWECFHHLAVWSSGSTSLSAAFPSFWCSCCCRQIFYI